MTPLLLKTSRGISQIYQNDTVTCLPNTQLRSAIKRLEFCKIVEQELDLTKKNNNILLIRILDKDSVIKNFEKKDSLHETRYANSLIQIGNLTEQIEGEKKITSIYRNISKKNKVKYASGGFIVGVLTMLVVFITK